MKLVLRPVPIVFGVPKPKPFVMPAWMPGYLIVKLRFRPESIATVILHDGSRVREFAIRDEGYYHTVYEDFEFARNEQPKNSAGGQP